MDAEPLSGMAVPLDNEAVWPDPTEPDEGRIKAGAIALQEAAGR